MLILSTALVFCALFQIGLGVEYNIYFEDVEVEYAHPEYIKGLELVITGDETIDTSFEILKPYPDGTEVQFELMGYSMGKYTLSTGINIVLGLCDVLDDPILIGPFFSVLGFESGVCPPKTGLYHQEGYTIPTDSLPEDFLENKYRATFAIFHGDEIFVKALIYVDVQAQ